MQAGGVGFYPIGTPWVHIDSGSVRYWPRMSRDALTRLFPDGKTVFIPVRRPADAGLRTGARRDRGARRRGADREQYGAQLFAWLFGARGGGADDAEEGGAEVDGTRRSASRRAARRPWSRARRPIRSPARAPTRRAAPTYLQPAPVQVASAANEIVSMGRGGFQRGGAFTPVAPSAPAPVAAAKPVPVPAPAPTPAPAPSPTPVQAPAPAPAPPPTLVASAAPEPPAAADPVSLHGPIAAKFIAPLPPRRPADLSEPVVVAAAAPTPPARPAQFALAETAPTPPPAADARAADADMIAKLIARSQLPGEITRGLKSPPKDALALVDSANGARARDGAAEGALARAALLNAPLPPPRPVERAPAKDSGTTIAPRAIPPVPPARVAAPGSAETTPYGGLIVDAFNAEGGPTDPVAQLLANGLRGSAQ